MVVMKEVYTVEMKVVYMVVMKEVYTVEMKVVYMVEMKVVYMVVMKVVYTVGKRDNEPLVNTGKQYTMEKQMETDVVNKNGETGLQ